MLNNWANNPPRQEHAVEDICNSTTVINGNTCYANPAKVLYYHSAFICRLELQPLARLWLPVCMCVCVCRWVHIIKLAGTECIHATCIVYCVAHSLSLAFPSSITPSPPLPSSPLHPFLFASSLILQPPGEGPTMGTFTADLPFYSSF